MSIDFDRTKFFGTIAYIKHEEAGSHQIRG